MKIPSGLGASEQLTTTMRQLIEAGQFTTFAQQFLSV